MGIINNKFNPEKINLSLGGVALVFVAIGALLCLLSTDRSKARDKISSGGEFLNQQSLVGVSDNFFEIGVKAYDEIRGGESLYGALVRLGVNPNDIDLFSRAFGRVLNLRALKIGTALMIEYDSAYGQWQELSGVDKTQRLRAVEIFPKGSRNPGESVYAYIKWAQDQKEVVIENSTPKVVKYKNIFSGKVRGSLYQSMSSAGVSSQMISAFTEIFAWRVDFYRETREDDEFCFIAEENYVDGRKYQGGEIFAAEYISGPKRWQAFYFESENKSVKGFFDSEGRSLRDAFLKSPIKLAQISSRFGMRFHPVQNQMKHHNGVDYGAVKGTPIMAVASGTVTQAGYNRFNGNFVKLKHLNGYETEYLHASNLGKGVRVGAKIDQGQVIAYVGRTGMATGYHLHFGMKLNGRYINPISQRAGRAAGLPSRYLAEFKGRIAPLTIALNDRRSPKEQILAQDGG